jgi:hypothetical protein
VSVHQDPESASRPGRLLAVQKRRDTHTMHHASTGSGPVVPAFGEEDAEPCDRVVAHAITCRIGTTRRKGSSKAATHACGRTRKTCSWGPVQIQAPDVRIPPLSPGFGRSRGSPGSNRFMLPLGPPGAKGVVDLTI